MVELTMEQLKAQLAEAQAQNAELKAHQPKPPGITLKVSAEKKCLSVYGLMRNPVTLYKNQWVRLLAESDRIKEFIANHPELAEKVKQAE